MVARTVDYIIDEKIKILKDFYIVDGMNEESIRNIFKTAVKDHPDSDPDVVVDRIAKSMIAAKL